MPHSLGIWIRGEGNQSRPVLGSLLFYWLHSSCSVVGKGWLKSLHVSSCRSTWEGKKLAFVPIYLGSLLTRLYECVATLCAWWAAKKWQPTQTRPFYGGFIGVVQGSSPKPIKFSTMVIGEMVTVDGLRRTKATNVYRAEHYGGPVLSNQPTNLCPG